MSEYDFWLTNPQILYTNYLDFIPNKQMNRVEQLNAMTRLLIYCLIIVFILNISRIYSHVIISLIGFICILYFFCVNDKEKLKTETTQLTDKEYEDENKQIIIESGYYDSNNKLKINKIAKSHPPKHKKLKLKLEDYTKYEKAMCRKPTSKNPFMNNLLKDITINDMVEPMACNTDDEQINQKITECFNENLYRDVGDLFERHNSQRQFYSTQITHPNDQSAFANWCFKTDNICKVDQSKCLKYEDLKYKRIAN